MVAYSSLHGILFFEYGRDNIMKSVKWLWMIAALSLGCQGLFGQTTDWYDREWTRRMQITIDQSKVVGTLYNFPVLIAGTQPGWKHMAQGGHVGQVSGADFLFTAGDGTTKLAHEIEGYDPDTGTLTVWVNVGTLSSSVQTELYVYYGNSACATQWNTTATWNTNFKMVQHLQQAPTNGVAGFLDSTASHYNGTPVDFGGPDGGTTDTPGRFDGGVLFDGSCHIRCGTGGNLRPNPVTVEFWVNLAASAKTRGKRNTFIGALLAYWIYQHESNDYMYFYYWNGAWKGSFLSTSPNLAADRWYYCAITFDKVANKATYYLDGNLQKSTTFTDALPVYSPGTFYIGSYNGGTTYNMAGKMDEVRISNTERSAAWIKTTYNSLNSPATFFSLSKAECYPGGTMIMLR